MRKLLLIFTTAILAFGGQAQIEYGGEPQSWHMKRLSSHVNRIQMNAIDLELAKQQDEVTDQYKETLYRFGIEHEVDIDFFEEATATLLEDENYIWRLAIECPDALSINFLINDFFIPEGGRMFVYSPGSKEKKGAFTSENNRENRIFPVGLLAGSEIVIEYQGELGDDAALHISQITHGYRPIVGMKSLSKGPFGNSGPCNINVNCPEGDAWDEQKRSVSLILLGGFICSGSLINNVLEDETPLYLSANHCFTNGSGPASWTFYFNHESTSCNGNTGPINQSVSGATLLANNAGSDFVLVQMNNDIPESFDVCYAGFDATDNLTPSSSIGIHHPSGDVKKICFEEDAPYHSNASGAAVWWIDQWELGVTEGGSSGSPLFDQNGRVIGQLFGGTAACSGNVNNGEFDFYGRLGVSWEGSSATNRLKDHLDPGDSGTQIMDTFCPSSASSIEENEFSELIEIYPNPVENVLNLKINDHAEAFVLRIINALGQTIRTEQVIGNTLVTIDVQEISGGSYLLIIENETYTGSKRITVK